MKYKEKELLKTAASLMHFTQTHQLFYKRFGGVGHILMLHRVKPLDNKNRIHNHYKLEIEPKQLEELIQYFAVRNYQFITLDDLAFYLKNRTSKKFVIFTFDDGYIDNYTIALPVFEKYNIPFTVYIAANYADHKAILWWYILEDIVVENSHVEFAWKDVHYSLMCSNTASKEKAFDLLRKLILQIAPAEIPVLLRLLKGNSAFDPFQKTNQLMLDWELVKALSKHPLVTIGAHTMNHYPLSMLDMDAATKEICMSQKVISDKISGEVRHLSYPFGSINEVGEREFTIAKECGFQTATTTRFSNIHKDHIKYLNALPRITINSTMNKQVYDLCFSGLIPAFRNRYRRLVYK